MPSKGSEEMTSTVYIDIGDGSPCCDFGYCQGHRKDGFLMPNVSNFYKQHSVRMQEMEVG